jgi:YbgC/YbaW family acyl-CoA thioester hydrolase
MPRNKIIPPTPACFVIHLQVKESDINHGGHVGNERYLLFAQEARLAFLKSLGCTELKFSVYGLILAETHVEYLTELFIDESIEVHLSIAAPARVAFECYCQVKTNREGKSVIAANIKSNMVCFDYKERKVKSIPEEIKSLLLSSAQIK